MGFFSSLKKDDVSPQDPSSTHTELSKEEVKNEPVSNILKTEEKPEIEAASSVEKPIVSEGQNFNSQTEISSQNFQEKPQMQTVSKPLQSSPEIKRQEEKVSAPVFKTAEQTAGAANNRATTFKPAVKTTPIAEAETFDAGVKGIDGRSVACRRLGDINDVSFSDVYITPDKSCYCWGGRTNAGLLNVSFADFNEFFSAIEGAYTGTRSYLLQYKGRNYRVERTIATEGPQYCARKMPTKVPDFRGLGLPQGVYNHLLSLAGGSGLILLAGATGSGKSTTIASLLKEYLSIKGGYAFTIEDPVELPLDGVYITPQQELGLCKQTTPPDGSWEEGIKSALRSKPRYIYLGEIRSPDIASEALRAATSGHLVLSSIHANNVSEAINSLVKYAASSGISEAMAFELVAGGFLGCVHQILSGAPKRVHVSTLFANPDVNAGCQVRAMIRSGKLNMATLIEQQRTLLSMQKPLFSSV